MEVTLLWAKSWLISPKIGFDATQGVWIVGTSFNTKTASLLDTRIIISFVYTYLAIVVVSQ